MYVLCIEVVSRFLCSHEQINARDKANQHPLSGDSHFLEELAINSTLKTAIVPPQLDPLDS
jgi:hypothetical protein